MSSISIEGPPCIINHAVNLPASKSISNRLLLLNALSPVPAAIGNLSIADDTRLLKECIDQPHNDINFCGDGGTTLRFLTALAAIDSRKSLITGSDVLQNRPVKPLTDALQLLGCEIEFTRIIDFPPFRILKPVSRGGEVRILADISSQFISAIMMIAPQLKNGLIIYTEGEMVSSSYLHTTAEMMKRFSVEVVFESERIIIPEAEYKALDTTVPSDWSAASYWFAFAACLPGSTIHLNNLLNDSLQGDQQISTWMKAFGVTGVADRNYISIHSEQINSETPLQFDCTDCPDLAQTLAVTASVTGRTTHILGLSTLKNKETNRIAALKNELEKTGVSILTDDHSISISGKVKKELIADCVFNTWNDHRMAMSLSILACAGVPVRINNPEVVSKSYPDFFKDLANAQFRINQ